MVKITCIVWCLVLAYGVSGESPTPSPDQWWVESSVSEESSPADQESEWKETATLEHAHYELPHPDAHDESEWKETDTLENAHYELLPKDARGESEWTAYSPGMYPLFRNAVKELSASEHGILLFWDALNRPEPPRKLFEQVFAAYDRLASEDTSSSSTEPQEATMYHLATMDPEDSEVVTDGVYTVEDDATSVDDSSEEYHSVSHDGDEAAVYYTTESPSIETMLTDGAFYASSTASDDHEDVFEDEAKDVHVSNEDVYEATEEEVMGTEDFNAVSESEWDNIVRRSGVVVENHPSTKAEPCEGCPIQVGSIRGIPGVHFPNYDDIPITSFSCADKRISGVYADLETGCQVFHICWSHRRESYLCPIGTTFNQAILTCDYWYSTNCTWSSLYFDVTTVSPKSTTSIHEKPMTTKPPTPVHEKPTTAKPTKTPTLSTTKSSITEVDTEVPQQPHIDLDWFRLGKFTPVKSKVTFYSKHSAKKPGSKLVVKQKHDVLPLVEEFLEIAKNVAKNAIRFVPHTKVDVVKPGIPKSKLVEVKPAAKLEPCLKVKDIKVKPTPPVIKKPQPLPKLDPRFIVKPVVGKKPQPLPKLDPRFIVKPVVGKKLPVVHVKKDQLVFPKVPLKQVAKPLGIKTFKPTKHHTPAIVMKALEVAGNVFQREILDLTRQALVESHV